MQNVHKHGAGFLPLPHNQLVEVFVHDSSLPAEGGNSAAVGDRGTVAAMVVHRVANNTEGGVADHRAAVAANPRAGVAVDAADCSAVGSLPIRPRYSCLAAASAWAAVADTVATDSADPAVDCGDGTVVGDGRVVAATVAVAVPDVVVLRKLLPTLPDSAAAAGVDGVRAVGFLQHS